MGRPILRLPNQTVICFLGAKSHVYSSDAGRHRIDVHGILLDASENGDSA